MKLSVHEMMLGEQPIAEKFAIVKECGFDGIDLRGDLMAGRIDEVTQLIAETGVTVPNIYGRITTPLVARTERQRAEAMELVRDRLAGAQAVGAANVIVVPIFGPPQIAVDRGAGVEEVEEAVLLAQLAELEDVAREAETRIVIEPLNRDETHLFWSPAKAAAFVRLLKSLWVGTMIDTYHMDREGQNALAEIDAVGDKLDLVHLSDRNRRLPGEGGIDFGPIVQHLQKVGYNGWLGFECTGPFIPEQLTRSVGYVRSLEHSERR